MKKTLYFLIIVISLRGNSVANAQSNLGIGQWESHLPYFQTIMVTQNDEQVFYATEESVFILDKEELTIDFLTRIEGLSQTGIQHILFDEANEQLIIAYRNSVIDFVTSDEIITISDIRDKSDIQGDKLIYDMYIRDGRTLYMAAGFGLIEFDLLDLEFGFTMNIAQRVSKVDGSGSELIIALNNPNSDQVGSYRLDLNSTNTPGFFPGWDRVEPSQGLPQNYEAKDVLMFEDKVYICLEEQLYVSEGNGNFEQIYETSFDDFELNFVEPAPEGIMMGSYQRNPISTGRGALTFINDNNVVTNELTSCFRNIIDAVIDDQGRIFFSDIWKFLAYLESQSGPCTPIFIDSPYDAESQDIDVVDGKVYVASGGVNDNFSDDFGRNGVYILQDNSWTNLHELTNDFIDDNDLIQMFKVAVSPRGDKAYFASFWAGLAQYDIETQTFDTLYNETNSALQFQQGNPRVKISGLGFDEENTLWVSNFGAVEPLCALNDEGEWFSFRLNRADATFLADIDVDNLGNVWVAVGGTSGGLVIYDKGGDLADTEDDRQRFLNQGNSEIPSNFVNAVKVDRSGAVWVGTGAGAVVFECGGSALEDDCLGNKRRVQVDGITAFLLESEDVLSIAVDGADRKWFGTRNGIFVQSQDGEDEVMRFNVNNSPLFDNTVRSMDFEEQSGLMYIGTDQGLQAIRTETTGSRNIHESNVLVFPNPVRADHTGSIAIRGLATDAEVRITDIDGHLVFKSRALGGQAIWDGQDFHGNEVASGVYLVFSSSTDQLRDIDSHVTKILVVR